MKFFLYLSFLIGFTSNATEPLLPETDIKDIYMARLYENGSNGYGAFFHIKLKGGLVFLMNDPSKDIEAHRKDGPQGRHIFSNNMAQIVVDKVDSETRARLANVKENHLNAFRKNVPVIPGCETVYAVRVANPSSDRTQIHLGPPWTSKSPPFCRACSLQGLLSRGDPPTENPRAFINPSNEAIIEQLKKIELEMYQSQVRRARQNGEVPPRYTEIPDKCFDFSQFVRPWLPEGHIEVSPLNDSAG